MRLKVLGWLGVCVCALLMLGVFHLTCIQGRRLRYLSDKNCVRLLAQEGCRGRILDRNGEVIAGSRLSYNAMLLPQDRRRTDELLVKVAGLLGKDVQELRAAFRNNFVSSSMPVAIARNIDARKAIALEEMKMDLDGLLIQPQPLRDYPRANLASHVIGYLSEIDHWRLTKLENYGYKTKDIVGFGGIEERYDYYLRQEEGGLSFEVDHRGRFVRVLGFRPPASGKDITLTLDVRLQKIAEDSLAGRKGCVILMDPNDGQILAMASFPDFSPEMFVKKSSPASIEEIFSDPEAPLVNRAISGLYPAASVFKVIVAAAGLETGKIRPSTTFPCGGGMQIGARRFACWDVHQPQDVHGALVHSCDVFFYHTGLALGPELIHEYAVRFGLTKPSGIELPYEAAGFLPHPLWRKIYSFKRWYDGDTANFAIGQGEVLVTPLQMARMMAAIANKGTLVTPHIVMSIGGRQVSQPGRKAAKIAVKAETIELIRQGLRDVVADPTGTAVPLASLPVPVAGKTGTAQVPRGQPHGWFVGFFPFQRPRFVVCVFLENGGSGYYSAIVAKEIIEKMLAEGLV